MNGTEVSMWFVYLFLIFFFGIVTLIMLGIIYDFIIAVWRMVCKIF